ncbi:TPA: hypothetical protein I7151_14085 [Vibrio vulnificus]|nr:hypothetical protein [Vibrio vulnificus]HAU8284104.1 hypothetical protein [Vibrio vulnificus]
MSAQILENLQSLEIPKFVGCLIGFQCWMAVSLTCSKCGKGKLIEALAFAVIS